MPDPYFCLSLATIGESQGAGTGAAGFGGAAAGLAAAGAAGAAVAGFAGAGLGCDDAETDSGESEGVAFTPPALAGCPAAAFGSPSGGGELGDLMSSGIIAQAQLYGSVCIEKNDNFYQLEGMVSTRDNVKKSIHCGA